MRLTLSRQDLLQAVQRCQSIVEKRHTVPILSNILIEADGEDLSVTATDLEVGIRACTRAEVKEQGVITVSARKMFEILKELNDSADVHLSLEAGFIHLMSGRSKFRLATLPAENFPAIREEEEASLVSIDGNDLARMIASTSFAMSHDETRKYLTGTLFELDEAGHIRLVATDGHRMAMHEATLHKKAGKCQSIVPRKAVMEIRRLAEECQGKLDLYIGERQVRVVAGSNSLSSKLIDARFPSYAEVIPQDNPEVAVIPRVEMDRVLRRSMIVANEFTHDVRLQFRTGEVVITTHNTEQEEAEESIEVDYSGPDLEIGFNGRYLRDVLGVVSGEHVRMEMKDSLSPVLLFEDGNQTARYVVMPMRI